MPSSTIVSPEIAIPDFCTLKEFDPLTLNFALRASNFSGLTGRISFNTDSSSRSDANFVLKQYDEDLNPITVGEFIDGNIYVNISKLTFDELPVSGKEGVRGRNWHL